MVNALMGGWPSGTGNASYPQEPSANMLLGRVLGYPAGTQRACSDAERLLSQAVGWWDASYYREGDRFLRNLGTGQELLDLRLGSSFAPNSNDPLFLAPEDQGYVYLPGVAGNRLSVPDENALDTTGDIDIRVRVAMDGWITGSLSYLFGKYAGAGNRSYILGISASGVPQLRWTTDGTTQLIVNATAGPNVSNRSALWLRVTLDVDNGASGHDVKFYTSDDGVAWTQLGATVTTVGVTSIFSGSATVSVGSDESGNAVSAGNFYAAQIWDGIEGSGGTKVLDIDCSQIGSGSATSFTAVTNQTVTVNRSASGRKAVAMPSRWNGGRPLFLFGTDDRLEIPAANNAFQHNLLNFHQGDSFTFLGVFRYWTGLGTSGTVMAKRTGGQVGGTDPGWALRSSARTNDGNALGAYQVSDIETTVPGIAAATTQVAVAVTDRCAHTFTVYGNSTASVVRSTRLQGGIRNFQGLTIGSTGSNLYADMEFTAAAVFRRALTRDEIATITAHYTGA